MKKSPLLLLYISLFLLPYCIVAQNTELENTLELHVQTLASPEMEGRGLGTEGSEKAREYILQEFQEAGLDKIGNSIIHPFKIRQGLAWIPAFNIVGVLEGKHPILKDEIIVIGAHYDHMGYVYRSGNRVIYPGADDNASGVAALIELAHYLGKKKENLNRTLVFVAFDAEESGLWGAQNFLSDSIVHPENIKAMFSMDMVGMYSSNKGLDLKGIATIEGGKTLAEDIAVDHSIQLKNTSAIIERRTDTWPFGSMGIPAIHGFTGLNSPYHKPEDTYDQLDYAGMAQVKTYLADLIWELDKMEEIKRSSSFEAQIKMEENGVVEIKKPFFRFGLTMHNGSGYHNYQDDFFRAQSLYNFAAGIFTQFHLSNSFAVQPEILFDLNGSQMEEGNFRRQSITIPINIQYNIGSIENELRVFPFIGGYYRYNYGGKIDGTSIDYENLFEETEYGLNFGLGIEIMQIQIGWTARRALSDLNQPNGNSIRDVNNYFTLGYRF